MLCCSYTWCSRLLRPGWDYLLRHPITVNAAADRNADSNYEMLWESQTDDLYVLHDGEQENSLHSGVAAEGVRRAPAREVYDGGYATFESLKPSSDVYGTTPGGALDSLYSEPEVHNGAPPPASGRPMRMRDMPQPLTTDPEFEYTTNEGIAFRARMGSIRPKFPDLMPEITGQVPHAMPPPRTSMGTTC